MSPTRVDEVRTQPVIYGLIGGICGGVFVFAAIVAFTKEPTLWLPTIGEGLILILFLSWFATTRLTLTNDSIRYRSLLRKTDVPLTSIRSVRFEQGFIPFSYKPYLRVIITVRDGARKKDITLNAGLFHPARVRRWIEAVNAKLSSGI
jgi:hypothetical protein